VVNPETDIEKARNLYIRGNWKAAIDILEKQSSFAAMLELGTCYIYSSQFDKAIKVYEDILTQDRLDTEIELRALFGEAIIFSRLGEFDEALFLFEYIEKRSSKSSVLHISSLIEMSYILVYQGFKSKSKKVVNQAYDLSKQFNFKNSEADALRLMAVISMLHGEFEEAINFLKQSIKRKKQLSAVKGIIRAKNYMGFIYDRQGNFDQAEKIYEEIKDLNQKIEDPLLNSYILDNIATSKKRSGDYTKAYQLYEEALQILTVIDDRQAIANNLLNMGIILLETGDIGKAIESFRKAAEFYEEIGDKIGLGNVVGSIAQAQFALGQLPLSQEFFKEAIELYNSTNAEFNLVTHLTTYAELLITLNNIERSASMLNWAFQLANKHNSPHELLMCNLTKAIFQIYSLNFGYARSILQDVATKADALHAYAEKTRCHILLAELDIFRYQVRYQDHDIHNAMEFIVIAEELADRQGLYPLFLETLIVKAFLYSLQLHFDIAIDTLLFVQKKATEKHLLAHQQRSEILLKRIHNRPEFRFRESISESKTYFIDKTLSVITEALRQDRKPIVLKENSTSLILYEVNGSMPTLIGKYNFTRDMAKIAQFGIYFSLAIGQGLELRDGLYGPLPTPDDKERWTLVYAESIFPSRTFLLCFIFPKFADWNFRDRITIKRLCSKTFSDVLNKKPIHESLEELQTSLESFSTINSI
jgi:tetratricopeptide (TPR) repeat protein